MHSTAKLYLVTRQDLSAGQQAVQACHALRQFTAEHPAVDQQWYIGSNYLALLSAKDQRGLQRLMEEAQDRGIRYAAFREPDLNNAVTAVAFEPTDAAKRLCRGLPLALQ